LTGILLRLTISCKASANAAARAPWNALESKILIIAKHDPFRQAHARAGDRFHWPPLPLRLGLALPRFPASAGNLQEFPLPLSAPTRPSLAPPPAVSTGNLQQICRKWSGLDRRPAGKRATRTAHGRSVAGWLVDVEGRDCGIVRGVVWRL